jgi:hypothetical protein
VRRCSCTLLREIRSYQTRRQDRVQPSQGTTERFRAFPPSASRKKAQVSHPHSSTHEPCNPFAANRDRSGCIRPHARCETARWQAPDAEPKYAHGCRITAVHPHHLLASRHTRSATSHHTEVQSSACGATTLPFMLCSTACVYNCRGRQTAEVPSDGESCIPVPNLMQLRAANDDVELILLSSYSSQGPLPNQQPRRGLV